MVRESYKIRLNGRWSLDDLYVFPRTFEQVYFAVEAITPSQSPEDGERIARAFAAFPWRGGYSAVNFYNQLKHATPRRERPEVRSIQYASPGWLELALVVPIAATVGRVVKTVASSLDSCNSTYNTIHRDLQNRKLLRIEVESRAIKLKREELALIRDHAETMAALMDLPPAHSIDERSHDPLITLKILLSLYRRVRTLASYETRKKASLPTEDEL